MGQSRKRRTWKRPVEEIVEEVEGGVEVKEESLEKFDNIKEGRGEETMEGGVRERTREGWG